MDNITNANMTIDLYAAIVSIALIILGIQFYRLLKKNKKLVQQTIILEEQNSTLRGQVAQRDRIINDQKERIKNLERVVDEQGHRIKQYESFITNLKDAQEKARKNAAKTGVPLDEVHIEAKTAASPNKNSGSGNAWLMGGMMIARLALLTVGVPPIF